MYDFKRKDKANKQQTRTVYYCTADDHDYQNIFSDPDHDLLCNSVKRDYTEWRL